MSHYNGTAHNDGTDKTFIALNHIRNAPAAVQTVLSHRLSVTEISGCQVVALDEVFALLAAALLDEVKS
jgi:hypothetical protein